MRALLLVATGCGRIAFDAEPEDPTLVVHLAFDDDPGDGVANSGGPDGHCVATCPAVVDGAYVFSAPNTGIAIADAPALHFAEGTIAAWVRFDATPSSYAMVVGKPFGSLRQNSYELVFGYDNQLML